MYLHSTEAVSSEDVRLQIARFKDRGLEYDLHKHTHSTLQSTRSMHSVAHPFPSYELPLGCGDAAYFGREVRRWE